MSQLQHDNSIHTIIAVLSFEAQPLADDEQEAASRGVDASQIAQQAAHALRGPVPRDSVPASTQQHSSSRRTTADSILDRLLREIDEPSVARRTAEQATAQPSVDGSCSTADTTLPAVPTLGSDTGPQPAASNPKQSSNSRRTSASGAAANVNPLLSHANYSQDPAGHRSTVDSVLASVLDQVEHEVNEDEADQASVDSLLDGVLAEVAGAASRQRTTADSVLDAMLDDMANSGMDGQAVMRRQVSGMYSAQASHLQQQQLQGVRHLLCSFMHIA